jgi:hypothetical protein
MKGDLGRADARELEHVLTGLRRGERDLLALVRTD